MLGKRKRWLEAGGAVVLLLLALYQVLPNFYEVQDTWIVSGPENEIIFSLGNINAPVVYTPDGNTLAVPTGVGVFVWDLNGNPNKPRYFLHEYYEDAGPVSSPHCFAISPDGSRLLDGKYDGTITVFDIPLEKPLYRLPSPQPFRGSPFLPANEVMCLAVSPDGKQFAVGHRSGLVRVMNLQTTEERCSFDYDALYSPDSAEAPLSLTFSPDGNRLLIGHTESTSPKVANCYGDHCLIDLRDPAQIQINSKIKSHIQAFAFLPDGESYCTLAVKDPYISHHGSDTTAVFQIWDIHTLTEMPADSLPQPKGQNALYFDRRNDLYSLEWDISSIRIRNESTAQLVWERNLIDIFRDFSFTGFALDPKHLLCSTEVGIREYRMQYRDARNTKIIRDLNTVLRVGSQFGLLGISNDARKAIGISHAPPQAAVLIDLEKQYALDSINVNPIHEVGFSEDGKRILLTLQDRAFVVLDTNTLNILKTIPIASAQLQKAVQLPADGNSLLIGEAGGARLIDLETDETVQTFSMPSQIRAQRLFDGKIMSADSRQFWISDAVFLPDGKRLITKSIYDGPHRGRMLDTSLRMWNIQSGEILETLILENSNLKPLSVSGDCQWLAAADGENEIMLIDLNSKRRYKKHIPGVHAVDFSPDGKRLLIHSAWDVVQLWDLDNLLNHMEENTNTGMQD